MKTCFTIDMDNYQEYRSLLDPEGDRAGESFYFDAVPRFLDILDAAGARATFFLIGRDAKVAAHRPIVKEIANRGHEIGNHSYTHPYNFRCLSRQAREAEIRQTEDAIADITGEKPVGFRTPSADLDVDTLELLMERGYLYDSSVMPSPLMLAFMLYGKVFVRRGDYQLGTLGALLAPQDPYLPDRTRLYRAVRPGRAGPGHIVEMPFSLLPVVRFPFYSTLLRMFGGRVFDLCTGLYGRRRPMLHFLCHLIDVVDLEGTPLGDDIDRAPGLGVPVERRRRFIAHVARRLAERGEAVPLREVAAEYAAQERPA